MTLRHALSWKPLFYDSLLPALRWLGPARGDAILGVLGRALAAWPPRRRAFDAALDRARDALGADWDRDRARSDLAANALRFLARDVPLEGADDGAIADRFDLAGFDHVADALADGRGLILLGCHLGGHLAALHWLDRRGVPLRLFVQRPQHVSATLRARFDRAEGPHPQPRLSLKRGLTPAESAERIVRARAALRDGFALYMAGDIPWRGPNARPGRLIGQPHAFLSAWADLAAIARVPVVPLFCTHRPGGRYALTFDAPLSLRPGDEPVALARYLRRLDAEVAAHPGDAVAHLTWPCYGPEADRRPERARRRTPRTTATPAA